MDVKGIISSIAQQLAENLNAERCTIRVSEGEKLKLIAIYGATAELRQEEIDITGTIAGETFRTGRIQNTDITKDNRYDPSYIIHNEQKFLLAIPLQFEGEKLGVAQVYAREPFSSKQTALAQTLSQYVALILYHEEFRKTIRKTTLKMVKAIIEGNTFEEISARAAEQISQNLQVERCTIYRIFDKNGQRWCEIAAGVPIEEHGIGLKEELSKHPDIQAVVNSQRIDIIDHPEDNPLTIHFRPIVLSKQINQILYIPVTNEIVLVMDATKEKANFLAEEIEFCFYVGQILTLVFNRIQADLQEWRHLTINPATSIGGWAKRISEAAQILVEEIKKFEQNLPKRL